jgi:hypothetical protein
VDKHLLQVSLVADEAGADQDSVPVQVEGERLPRVLGHLQAHPKVYERHESQRKKRKGILTKSESY